MSDEEITYSTVRFGKSSKLQNRGRPEETQGPKGAVHRECSVTWHLIAIPLGILGFFLLVAVAVLLTYVFQYSEKNNELQKMANNYKQQYQTLQINNSLIEEKLRNKSRECDDLKHENKQNLAIVNRCRGEIKVVLHCKQITDKSVEVPRFCCGIKCYFIMENKHWSGCKQACQECSLSLLKIDDEDELKFLQVKVNPNSYWIGLSYDERNSKWKWIDNDPSNLDLMTVKSLHESKSCASLSFKGIQPYDCGRNYPCICEKRKDKFPHSVCSMEEKSRSVEETD